MSKFPSWFTKAYNRWKKSQLGEENFPAFCDLLGYPATKVMSWLHGEIEPQGHELLNIAGVCGTDVYSILEQPEPDPELLANYQSFPHLSGEDRSRLAQALFEVNVKLPSEGANGNPDKLKFLLDEVFDRWGINKSKPNEN